MDACLAAWGPGGVGRANARIRHFAAEMSRGSDPGGRPVRQSRGGDTSTKGGSQGNDGRQTQDCTDFLGCEPEGLAQSTPPREGFLRFEVFGWNIGGCDMSDLTSSIREAAKASLDPLSLIALQELPRAEEGWSSEKHGGFEILSFRPKEAWRGSGVAYHTEHWSVLRKVVAGRGVWVKLKGLSHGCVLWVGSAHFTPGCTQSQYEREVADFMQGAPRGSDPVVVQVDANAALRWNMFDSEILPVGKDGKSNEFLGVLESKGFRMIAPDAHRLHLPTSRPRQEGRKGNIIDYMASRRVQLGKLQVHQDSHLVLGTDHELLQGSFRLPLGRVHQRVSTRPRVWKGGINQIDRMDQEVLVSLARTCTVPKRGHGYRDPQTVKHAIQVARVQKSKEAWVAVRALRKRARAQWEKDRLARASQGDWQAVRESKERFRTGWEHEFAELHAGDPHQVVHDHLSSVYEGVKPKPNQGIFTGHTEPFSEAEFDLALQQMKGGKSVGLDGTSKELFEGIVATPGGKQHVIEYFNRILITHDVPEQWNMPLMILLPKLSKPLQPKDLRPISMGSSASKLFSRMLLNRTLQHIQARTHSQCAGPGRQTSDYIFTVWRVLELEREWHEGLCLLKLDVAKAFDSVHRERLLQRLEERMGDSSEFRCWRALLQESQALLQTPWGSSLVAMTQGIKQGGVESPGFFAMLAEVCVQEAAERYGWHREDQALQGFPHSEVLFMDDGVLWARGTAHLEKKVNQLTHVLAEYGLKLNGQKCQLLCSPYWGGSRFVHISGVKVESVETMEVMGLPMRVGMTPCELIAPLIARARSKFWSLKHLLRASTGLKGRLQTMARLVGGAVLWCLSALPPDRSAMGLLNTTQLQLTIWAMRLERRAGGRLGRVPKTCIQVLSGCHVQCRHRTMEHLLVETLVAVCRT